MTDDAYERYLDEFGRELDRAAAYRAPRRPRVRLALVTAGAAVVAAAITAIALLAPSGHQRLDVLAEARAALSPRGEILHLIVRQNVVLPPDHPSSVRLSAPVQTVEQWSTTNPKRWRIRVITERADGMLLDAGGPVAGPMQIAYARGRQLTYVEGREKVRVLALPPAVIPPRVPGPAPGEEADPVAAVRTFMDDGTLHDGGLIMVEGQRLRRLTGTLHATDRLSDRLEYFVNPETFVPVIARIQRSVSSRPVSRRSTPIAVLHFLEVERLPRTPANERLLQLQTPSGTRTVPEDYQGALDRARAALRDLARERAAEKSR